MSAQVLSAPLPDEPLPPLPAIAIDRYGLPVDVSGVIWRLNDHDRGRVINWEPGAPYHPALEYALKRYAILSIQRDAPAETYNKAMELLGQLTTSAAWTRLHRCTTTRAMADVLSTVIEDVVRHRIEDDALYRLSRIRPWLRWSCRALSALGFRRELVAMLNRVKVPGNPKGEAVRTLDPAEGPLDDSERFALQRALESPRDGSRVDLQERAAVAVALAFGRNPANYIRLREEDLVNLTADLEEVPAEWSLRIPRIKKRGVRDPRQLTKTEYCDEFLGRLLQDLVSANRAIDTGGLPRPLFMAPTADPLRLGSVLEDWAWHMAVQDFSELLSRFVKRHRLVSPRTGEPLHLTPRRLRYSLATEMAKQGVPRRVLAEQLDHSDLQNVGVYFDVRSDIVPALDRAAAGRIGKVVGYFTGHVVDSAAQAVNGNRPERRMRFATRVLGGTVAVKEIGVCGLEPTCHLYPPYSCYLCNHFQPFREANHQRVFETLQTRRTTCLAQDPPDTRMAVQLDDLMVAVAEVITLIESRAEGGARALLAR